MSLYVIIPHWHDTGSWNLSSYKARTYLFYIVNIMDTDVLVTQGARASATIIFTMFDRNNFVPACNGLTKSFWQNAWLWLADALALANHDQAFWSKFFLLKAF